VVVPERIRLRRTAGWRKPPGAVTVARPSEFGNPFRVVVRPSQPIQIRASLGPGEDEHLRDVDDVPTGRRLSVEMFRRALYAGELRYDVAYVRERLAGRDLACWCPLDGPCHADVLLAAANAP
jgi:Domain of unknown function (DUF4326)